jgi:CobQ-like glutamine amidotransferase family enzyme
MGELRLRLCHLYPDLLNLYGDRANLLALRMRCAWRGVLLETFRVGVGERFEPAAYDLVLLGGGQDAEQETVGRDLSSGNGEAVREAVESGTVFLCICGGLQMMGRFYRTSSGETVPGLGALDLETHAGSVRMIGDVTGQSEVLRRSGRDPVLVGFENHAGKTRLGPGVQPLARVGRGHGNNGEDGTEGAIYKNTYCTYLHGGLLPKNPDLADHLLSIAAKRLGGGDFCVFDNPGPPLEPFSENARKFYKPAKQSHSHS